MIIFLCVHKQLVKWVFLKEVLAFVGFIGHFPKGLAESQLSNG